MNADTKRHIDSARQVLVGVVPNPASQIDQITNALIYKFMDDMDQAVIKAGGEPSFFVGSLKDYAWTRLMDSKVGNQQRMNLYSEALVKFSEAKQLPELFRGIFKSAYLPYRSPEVLDLFLKEINYFDYSHSEELGNAYEYLLSIMSSQGDAGQFRTPRHIIDFIVEVVNPTKDDKVLDPACGTAGFLISAYKHILSQHDGKNTDGTKNNEKPLTPDQRKTLVSNFEGYDIDPGMVRISQVNMYLHQFKNPKIYQYDSLSSDERWGDKFDVILANPPFMSPKGGVMPHNKFSVKSNRSEVLFVDYIMNHLRPKGRAGIIVPEGVIFQAGKAHTQLRKKLVEDGLCAVISLPSGVFNPYAGVKTSVLFFDNELSKQRKEILFIKIENDGFDLGAQRRSIGKNDLPEAVEILNKWKEGKKVESILASYVEREKIAENGDYNLSAERYSIAVDYSNAKWPIIKFSELERENKIKFLRGQGLSKSDLNDEGKNKCIHYGEIYTLYNPVIKHVVSRTDYDGKITSLKGDVLVPATTTADAMGIAVARSLNEQGVVIGGDINVIRTGNTYVLSDYVALLISNPPLKIELSKYAKGANILHLSNSDLKRLRIPVPPIESQKQIVEELDGYQKIISGAEQVIDNWRPKIDIDPKWEKLKIGELVKTITPPYKLQKSEYLEDGVYPIIDQSQHKIAGWSNNKDFLVNASAPVVIFGDHTCAVKISSVPFVQGADGIKILLTKDNLLPEFLYSYLLSFPINPDGYKRHFGKLVESDIFLPPIEAQKRIVERIEAEKALVESNKKLIDIYQQKIVAAIAKLWNE